MGTPAPFGTIYSSGSRHILIACCWDYAVCLFITKQVLILAEAGDWRKLTESSTRAYLRLCSCQHPGCARHCESCGNHEPVSLPSSCGRPACARTDCPVVVRIVTCGSEQDVGETPAGTPDCCASCGASRYTDTALRFPLPRRWGQSFRGSLPMSIKYRNGRMCSSKFQSCWDFVALIYRRRYFIYIYVL